MQFRGAGHAHPVCPSRISRGNGRHDGRHGCLPLDRRLIPTSPFRISVINDEISQDFGRACEVASREFGMQWIELRGMWNKNIVNLDEKEIAEARRILEKYQLQVTDIASPLFKVDWPGAPKSKFSESATVSTPNFTFEQQDEVLERAIDLAKTFQTDRVRCFDFWRLDDQAPYRAAINDKLRDAAEQSRRRKASRWFWKTNPPATPRPEPKPPRFWMR